MRTAQEIADEYIGTALTLELTKEEDASIELHDALDELMFECCVCGWWFADHDLADEDTCVECWEEG